MRVSKINPEKLAVAILLGITVFLIAMIFSSCKKEERPIETSHSVTYTLYSTTPKFVFAHVENYTSPGHVDTIIGNTYSVSLLVSEDVFTNEQSVQSVIVSPSDSLHIRAEYDGKRIERGFRSTSGLFQVSVNLAEAK